MEDLKGQTPKKNETTEKTEIVKEDEGKIEESDKQLTEEKDEKELEESTKVVNEEPVKDDDDDAESESSEKPDKGSSKRKSEDGAGDTVEEKCSPEKKAKLNESEAKEESELSETPAVETNV
ncbi:nucleolar protein 12-like isoform X2 [Limulus polyphemus]|nr:nucleolar protein 12-like isoform X2 [Limulus polyphemus]